MNSAKTNMLKIIQQQPEDSSFDEILRELVLARMIERGLEDSQVGRVIPDDEMRRRISAWGK